MKFSRFLLAAATIAVMGAGCSDDAGLDRVSLEDIGRTLEEPVLDYGAMHNSILDEMDAFGHSKGWTRRQYFETLTRAANTAYARHGLSRDFTMAEVSTLVKGVAFKIEPVYDLSFQDTARANPIAVLDRFLANGKLTQAEYEQMVPVFTASGLREGLLTALAAESEPVSDVVRHTMSTFRASLDFWIDGRSTALLSAGTGDDGPIFRDDHAPDKDLLRFAWGDALGTVTAALLGAGPFSPLVGAALSTAFHIDEGCIACGDVEGGTGGGGSPCDRGPCP